MRLTAATTSGAPILGWALAAMGGRSPDKMRIDQARREPDWPDFDKAVKAEVDALWDQGTWERTDLPDGKRITDTEMLCERKRGSTGAVTRHKGRYVVRGDKQIFLVEYNDVWAPVARYATLRTLLAFCAGPGLVIIQLDLETAFLDGHVEEEIYVRQPRGYERGNNNKVFRLIKALYGLKQAARSRYQKLGEVLRAAGFKPCHGDPCLFKSTAKGVTTFILVYVDDLLIAAPSEEAANTAKAAVTGAFKARDKGEPEYFLGQHVNHNQAQGTLHVL